MCEEIFKSSNLFKKDARYLPCEPEKVPES